MKPLVAALAMACTVLLFAPGSGMSAPLKRLSFRESQLYTGNPIAPELYAGVARLLKTAEQAALSRLLPTQAAQEQNLSPTPAKPNTVIQPGSI